jgi:hypothetical protein
MTTLHLGVLDVPYDEGTSTTGDVAEILEARYHIMELFVETKGVDAISKAFEESAQAALEDLLSGVSAASISLTAAAEQDLEAEFRKFIDQKSLDYVVPGVPTKASLDGVNHRFKHATAKGNPVRPSFKDTGLYEASFKAWTD